MEVNFAWFKIQQFPQSGQTYFRIFDRWSSALLARCMWLVIGPGTAVCWTVRTLIPLVRRWFARWAVIQSRKQLLAVILEERKKWKSLLPGWWVTWWNWWLVLPSWWTARSWSIASWLWASWSVSVGPLWRAAGSRTMTSPWWTTSASWWRSATASEPFWPASTVRCHWTTFLCLRFWWWRTVYGKQDWLAHCKQKLFQEKDTQNVNSGVLHPKTVLSIIFDVRSKLICSKTNVLQRHLFIRVEI